MVFINNEEETEALLQKNPSCWSRLATPIIVEDLNNNEAVEFLTAANFMEQDAKSSKSTIRPAIDTAMPLERAKRIVDLVGGRILHLIEFKRAWFRGISFEETAEELKGREREQLLKVRAGIHQSSVHFANRHLSSSIHAHVLVAVFIPKRGQIETAPHLKRAKKIVNETVTS
jgi:hypothetical protein